MMFMLQEHIVLHASGYSKHYEHHYFILLDFYLTVLGIMIKTRLVTFL